MQFRLQLFSLLFLPLGSHAVAGQQPACPSSLGEPMAVEGNAPVVTPNLKGLNGGKTRSARLLFDSGGGAIILDKGLADELGLKPTGEAIAENGERFAPTNPPSLEVSSMPVSLSTSKAFIHLGTDSFDTRERVEGMLPGKALEPYQLVLDYPRRRFTIAPAGCVKHRGVKVPSPSLPESGHPRIVVSLEGKTYGLLLDTGSRATLARRDLLKSLSAAHPKWPHSTGASGTADMPGASGEEFLLRVPELKWGALQLKNVLFVSRSDETFSLKTFETPGPIVGALGGNVLKNFRVEIDYPGGTTYLEHTTDDFGGDMNSVGLVLDVDAAKNLVVRAISETAATSTKRNVLIGDQIIGIDGKREVPWKIIDASNALSGRVGEIKRLVIIRNHKKVQTTAVVAHLL